MLCYSILIVFFYLNQHLKAPGVVAQFETFSEKFGNIKYG